MKAELVSKPYSNGDESNICELFEEVYKTQLSLDNWKWRFKNSPSGSGVIQLCWGNNVLASHYAVTPVRISILGVDHVAALSGTTMTNPDFRGLGLFPLLAEQVYQRMSEMGMIMVFGFPNIMSHRNFVKDLNWKDIYEIPMFRFKLDSLKRPIESNVKIKVLEGFDERFDNLWNHARNNYPVIGFRDCSQLTWRYVTNQSNKYYILAYIVDQQLRGYAVYKHYKNELQIVDIFTDNLDPEVGLALISEVIKLAAVNEFVSVALWLNLNTALHRELERLGFHSDAPITYFGARRLNDGVLDSTLDLMNNWYITMGDSDVF